MLKNAAAKLAAWIKSIEANQKLRAYVRARLMEKSTWIAAITLFATITGSSVDPKHADEIAMAGVTIASVLGMATKEDQTPANTDTPAA